MQWININITSTQSREFITADSNSRGAWISLLGYCVLQENGGRIKGAKAWPGRSWRTLFQTDPKVLSKPCGLWSWDGDDLILNFYPTYQESIQHAKRRGGKLGAKIKKENRLKKAFEKPENGSAQQGLLEGVPQGVLEPLLEGVPQGVLLGKSNSNSNSKGNGNSKGKGMQGETPPNGTLNRESGAGTSEHPPHIPSIEEALLWAQMSGVDPEWCRAKWTYVDSHHRWLGQNGRLVKWQQQWKSDFESDRLTGKWPRQKAADKNSLPAPARQLWQIEQELKTMEQLYDDHPCSHLAMGQVVSDDQKAEFAAIKKKIAALKSERRRSISGGEGAEAAS